ncbi:hypothetical protein RZS08_53195, partial [Arthrospira platensis SPKY1]|nr:hypothetical protein [Arthrospira platensis SPKY1]
MNQEQPAMISDTSRWRGDWMQHAEAVRDDRAPQGQHGHTTLRWPDHSVLVVDDEEGMRSFLA